MPWRVRTRYRFLTPVLDDGTHLDRDCRTWVDSLPARLGPSRQAVTTIGRSSWNLGAYVDADTPVERGVGLSVAAPVESVTAVGLAEPAGISQGTAHRGEGRLGPDSGSVVACVDQHLSGGVEADADGFDELRGRRLEIGVRRLEPRGCTDPGAPAEKITPTDSSATGNRRRPPRNFGSRTSTSRPRLSRMAKITTEADRGSRITQGPRLNCRAQGPFSRSRQRYSPRTRFRCANLPRSNRAEECREFKMTSAAGGGRYAEASCAKHRPQCGL